ncbi:MAG: hypothetical protein GY787_10385 [Alteromonadales bacterium]|nr:hypothetical protein [Alteromonadales bacterium]
MCSCIQTLKGGVKIKKLILSIDIDNDFTSTPREVESLCWKGLYQGLPQLLLAIEHVAITCNQILKVTLFCRADWQIRAVMGDSAWVFNETRQVVDALSLTAVQVDYQWHPHLYSFENGTWSFTLNEQEQCQQLAEIHSELMLSGLDIACSRIGECFFSQAVLQILQRLDILIDSTALPGRDLGYVDWTWAKETAFYPNVITDNMTTEAKLLEVPFSMVPILAPYENVIKSRYLNVVYQSQYVSAGIKNYQGQYIVTIAHPYELLEVLEGNKHQLLGDSQSVVNNVKHIISSHAPESLFLKELNVE